MLCPIPWNLSSFASVEGLESNIADEISQTIDKVGDTIEPGKDYVSDLLSQAADTVSDWASEVRDDVSDTVNVNDAMAWTNRNLMVTDYPGIHQTYQVAKTLGKTFGLVGMAMTGKSIYDDFKNYQGLNCAKAVAVDTGAFFLGWGVTVGAGVIASYMLAPTVVVSALAFSTSVALGAIIATKAESVKNSIDKVDK